MRLSFSFGSVLGGLSVHRIFDYTPLEDEVIVARMLTQLHQVIDDVFPNAQPASHRFAKTAFTYDEPTLTQVGPVDALREAAEAGRLEDAALEADAANPRFGSKSSKRQTLVGLALFIVIALIAYFLFQS